MSLQQNINNSIFSLAHMKFIHGVSKDYKEMRNLFKDVEEGKYAMTSEEIAKANKKSRPTAKGERDLDIAGNEVSMEMRLEENRNLMNEANRLRKAKPNLTPDEAQALARENITKKQAEYEKSRDDYEQKMAKNLERAHKHGKLGF